MVAPSPSTRATPSGIPLQDGYSTLVTFATDSDLSIWEKTVTPPGADGGEPVDTSTMHNSQVRTKAPRQLIDFLPSTLTCGYDPNVYNDVLALINVRTTITVTYPDGSTLAFYGYLQKFEPDAKAEGTYPEATVTIVPTNWDHVNNVEAIPVLTEVAGT